MKYLWLWLALSVGGCGFKSYRSPLSQNATLEEGKPGQDCEGRSVQGTAIVRSITPSRAGRELVAGRQYVHFDFAQKKPALSRVQMIISMTEDCLATNHLVVNQAFTAQAWIRTAGSCRPYVLALPGPACADQQSFEEEEED